MEKHYKQVRVQELIDRLNTQYKMGNFLLLPRSKNHNFIREIGWFPSQVLEYISEELEIYDYIIGPEAHHKPGNSGAIWIFGKEIEEYPVYIKVWDKKDEMICISFHESTKELDYYFKEER